LPWSTRRSSASLLGRFLVGIDVELVEQRACLGHPRNVRRLLAGVEPDQSRGHPVALRLELRRQAGQRQPFGFEQPRAIVPRSESSTLR
jgi:hypothetical protein